MKILWLLDTPEWAYDARVNNLISRLTDYEHCKLYVADRKMKRELINDFSKRFDIVVCMYAQYIELLDRTDNVVNCIGGFRALEMKGQTE